MSDAVCLRCDWAGRSDAASCPRCDAPLYRAETRAEPRSPEPRREQGVGGSAGRARPPSAEARPAAGTGEHQPDLVPPSTDSGGPWRVLLGLAAMVSGLALVWAFLPATGSSAGSGPGARAAAPPTAAPPPGGSIPRTGVLLYVADPDGGGTEVLWTLDLADGGALPGPRIPRVTAISDASLAGRGWVGLTAEGPRGVRVLVLHGTGVADRARPLGRGDLVAWAPRGDVVAVAQAGVRGDGCRGARIDVIEVATGARERLLRVPPRCDGLLALGRDINTTYFSMRSHGSVGIYSVGIDVAHPVLPGFLLQGVSPTADFLVGPEDGPARPVSGTRLFWPGTGGPIPYGHVDQPLVVHRVLAWSQDGSRAAVIGRAGLQRGVFLLDTSAGPDPRRLPEFVGDSGRQAFATFARDGTLYLAVDGVLVRYADGDAQVVRLPQGASRPSGAILWLP